MHTIMRLESFYLSYLEHDARFYRGFPNESNDHHDELEEILPTIRGNTFGIH